MASAGRRGDREDGPGLGCGARGPLRVAAAVPAGCRGRVVGGATAPGRSHRRQPVTLVLPRAGGSGGGAQVGRADGVVRPAALASGSTDAPDRRRGSRGTAGSGSRASTTPSWWRRCGAHDLRVEGVVVEPLHGADDLVAALADFGPRPKRRVGECCWTTWCPAARSRGWPTPLQLVRRRRGGGAPVRDVWQAVKPAAVGIERWPDVPASAVESQGHLGAGLAGRRARGLGAHPGVGGWVRRSGAGAPGPRRAVDRLRHRRVSRAPSSAPRSPALRSMCGGRHRGHRPPHRCGPSPRAGRHRDQGGAEVNRCCCTGPRRPGRRARGWPAWAPRHARVAC